MEDYLSPYEAEMNQAMKEDWSSFRQAKLLWKCIYTVLHRQRLEHPEWIYLSNEDLSLNARAEYQTLLEKLQIPFDEAVEKEVKASSEASSESWRVRDSKANAFKWKKKFSQEKIDDIREYMGEIGAFFYNDDFW